MPPLNPALKNCCANLTPGDRIIVTGNGIEEPAHLARRTKNVFFGLGGGDVTPDVLL